MLHHYSAVNILADLSIISNLAVLNTYKDLIFIYLFQTQLNIILVYTDIFNMRSFLIMNSNLKPGNLCTYIVRPQRGNLINFT